MTKSSQKQDENIGTKMNLELWRVKENLTQKISFFLP